MFGATGNSPPTGPPTLSPSVYLTETHAAIMASITGEIVALTTRRMQSQIETLEARIEAQERAAALHFRGVWRPGELYGAVQR